MDACEAGEAAAEKASGYDMAWAEFERQNARRNELAAEIVLTRALTIEGAVRKVRLLAEIYPKTEFESISALLCDWIEREGVVSDQTMAFGIARDLLALLAEGTLS